MAQAAYADDTFKVHIYNKTTKEVLEAPIGYLPSSAGDAERARGVVARLEPSRMSTAEFRRLFIDAYENSTCGKPGETIGRKFFDKALAKNTIYMMITNAVPQLVLARGRSAQPTYENVRLARSFILARPEDIEEDMPRTNALYIDLICASERKGVVTARDNRLAGKSLMQVATAYAITRGYDEIALSAVPAQLITYTNWDFNYRATCDGEITAVPEELKKRVFVDKALAAATAEHAARVSEAKQAAETLATHRSRIARASSRAELRALEEEKAEAEDVLTEHAIYLEENKPFLRFMLQLRRAGLEHNHDYDKKKDAACKNPRLTVDEIKELGCEQDGYKMRKCNIRGGGGGGAEARR